MKTKLHSKIIISCFLAACLEMYDFAIFGFFTNILYKNYLSFVDQQNAIIISYILFAVGFVCRPIGSIIFGYIGDIYGRKKALIVSVTFMGSASLGMALLPPYAIIGVASCYFIAAIRIIQGISVGGEYSGALIYAIEHFQKKQAGAIGGIVVCGCISGVFLATIVSKIVQSPGFPDYSWRIAFLLGFGLSIVGYFIRKNLIETPEFNKISVNTKKIPLIDGIKKYPKECLAAICTAAANGINFYFIIIFLPNHINNITGESVNFYPIMTTLILLVLSPIFGYLSDKYNRRKFIANTLIVLSFYGFIGLQLVQLYPSVTSATIFFCVHALLYSTQAATINTFIIEIFPPKYRFSCAALCYSIGTGIIGGTSPLIATLITRIFSDNSDFYLGMYMSGISFIACLSVILLQKRFFIVEKNQESDASVNATDIQKLTN